MDTTSREVITAKEAAARLGVSLASAYLLIHRGELEGYAVGRRKLVYADSLSAFRERHAFAAPPAAQAKPEPKHFKHSRRRPRPASMEPAGPFRHFR